jgi:hypothetical protein
MKTLSSVRAAVAAAGLLGLAGGAQAQVFTPGNLVVSRSVYSGDATTVTVGQALPGGGTAVANGAYPNVFQNNKVDGSFGVTAPIFLDQITTAGARVNSLAINPGRIVTSFPSKSELSLNLSTDGRTLSFMGYSAPVNALDVSNSNTPGVIEPGNPVTTTPTYRTVAQVDANGNLQTTNTNAYSGNNGRAAIYDAADNQYLTVGNAGNGNGSAGVTAGTGVQIVTPGQDPAAGTTKVGNFNITQYGYPADKSAKDNNFRGETVFGNTLFVTKGSGGNGINTVYQVGATGSLPTLGSAANAPITILPGFSTTLANSKTGNVFHPFGLFFANATTLYVADEGNQSLSDTAANNANAGLEKWSFVGNSWTLDYTLQNGLNLDQPYAVTGLPTSLNPATDGLRNLTGKVNGDGTVWLYGITSTVSASGDQGADPNKLMAINDNLSFTSAAQAAGETFTTLQSAGYGEVLRGVAFAPVPEAPSSALLGVGALGLLGVLLRKRVAAAK